METIIKLGEGEKFAEAKRVADFGARILLKMNFLLHETYRLYVQDPRLNDLLNDQSPINIYEILPLEFQEKYLRAEMAFTDTWCETVTKVAVSRGKEAFALYSEIIAIFPSLVPNPVLS